VRELVYLVATSIDGFIAKCDGDYTPCWSRATVWPPLSRSTPTLFAATAAKESANAGQVGVGSLQIGLGARHSG
jgi:hypothetical protein